MRLKRAVPVAGALGASLALAACGGGGGRQGAKVLVLDPVDAASASVIVQRAKQQHVPVISYDRLITNADIDYYVSFDNVRVGKLQAQTLVKKLRSGGRTSGAITMI